MLNAPGAGATGQGLNCLGFLYVSQNHPWSQWFSDIHNYVSDLSKYLKTDSSGVHMVGTSPFVDVVACGAVGDGITDDTNAIRRAIHTCEAAGGGTVFFPAGTYLVSGTGSEIFLIERPITIIGANQNNTIISVAASVGAATDIFRLHAVAGAGDFRYFKMQDIYITPAAGTPGRYGIVIDTTDAQIAYLMIDRVRIEALGSNAIKSTNPVLTSGFFCSIIQNCILVKGVLLNRAGDSIGIHNNVITGSGKGIVVDSVVGANMLTIINNNITSNDTAIELDSTFRTVIAHNNIESVAGGNYPANPVINITGTTTMVYEPMIYCNSILASIVTNTDAIHFDSVYRPYVGPNVLYTLGTGVGITTTVNTISPKIDINGISWAAGSTTISDVSVQASFPLWHGYGISLPVYANNAAAITGGLTVGSFYRTNSDPDTVCAVH